MAGLARVARAINGPPILRRITVLHANTGSELGRGLEHIGPDGLIRDGPWVVSRVITMYEGARGRARGVRCDHGVAGAGAGAHGQLESS